MELKSDKKIKSKSVFLIYSPYPLSDGDVLEIPWKNYNFIVFNDSKRIDSLYECKVYFTGAEEDVVFEDIVELTKLVKTANKYCNRFVIEKIQIPITLMEEGLILKS